MLVHTYPSQQSSCYLAEKKVKIFAPCSQSKPSTCSFCVSPTSSIGIKNRGMGLQDSEGSQTAVGTKFIHMEVQNRSVCDVFVIIE